MIKILKRHYFPILLGLIFIFGFLVRAIEVLTNNYIFLFDQGRDYLVVKEIVLNHKLTLIGASTGLHGIFSGPFWYYLLTIPSLFAFVEHNPPRDDTCDRVRPIESFPIGFYNPREHGETKAGIFRGMFRSG